MKKLLLWALITPVVLTLAAAFLFEFTRKQFADNKGLYVLAVLLFGPYFVVPMIAHVSVLKFMALGVIVMLLAATAGTWAAKALKWISKN